MKTATKPFDRSREIAYNRAEADRGESIGNTVKLDASYQRKLSGRLNVIVIPSGSFTAGKDYFDSVENEWIWSIGRHLESGEIHASNNPAAPLYSNPLYECLWLR